VEPLDASGQRHGNRVPLVDLGDKEVQWAGADDLIVVRELPGRPIVGGVSEEVGQQPRDGDGRRQPPHHERLNDVAGLEVPAIGDAI
jgi:hypothetical protein